MILRIKINRKCHRGTLEIKIKTQDYEIGHSRKGIGGNGGGKKRRPKEENEVGNVKWSRN
jgi:hypothetical protein